MVREDRQEELAHVDIWEGIQCWKTWCSSAATKPSRTASYPYLLLQLIVPTYSRTL